VLAEGVVLVLTLVGVVLEGVVLAGVVLAGVVHAGPIDAQHRTGYLRACSRQAGGISVRLRTEEPPTVLAIPAAHVPSGVSDQT